MAIAAASELLDIVRQIAPPDRTRGWHYEECEYDVDEWRERHVAENARAQTIADRGQRPPMPPFLPREQRGIDPERDAEHERMWAAIHSWAAHERHHIEDLVQYVHEPTDEDLCEAGCVYPSARRLLERLDGTEEARRG